MPDIGRRVIDRVTGEMGTVVDWMGEGRGRRRYRIDWDEPTPHQDQTWTDIPNQFFDWYDQEADDEQ